MKREEFNKKIDELKDYLNQNYYNPMEKLRKLYSDDEILDRLFTRSLSECIDENMILDKDIADGDKV